jgi:hypothetical protein
VLRSLHALPKSGTKRPWNVRQNYLADAIDYRFDRIEEAMVFGRAGDRAPLAGSRVNIFDRSLGGFSTRYLLATVRAEVFRRVVLCSAIRAVVRLRGRRL